MTALETVPTSTVIFSSRYNEGINNGFLISFMGRSCKFAHGALPMPHGLVTAFTKHKHIKESLMHSPSYLALTVEYNPKLMNQFAN